MYCTCCSFFFSGVRLLLLVAQLVDVDVSPLRMMLFVIVVYSVRDV